MKKTGFSKEQCIELHQKIHQCISLDVKQQHSERLLDGLKKGNPHQIAATLMSENILEVQTDSRLMMFQYAENKLIRPRQKEALQSLLSTPIDPHHYHEVIEKIIMGGGKSKIILPVMAAKKATGHNLVVIEVPNALLKTNHADLNATSQQLFNQKAHQFEFDRDSDCSAKHLKKINETLKEIISNKDYLVTTGASIQSLELKYLELLLNPPTEDSKEINEWEQQISYLSNSIELFKERGDVIIDEVHQGLLLKRKLNYTLGQIDSIPAHWIKLSIDLYSFAEQLDKPFSVDALLTAPKSPLKFPEFSKEELRNYFEDKAISETILKALKALKERLDFYKAQLTLFPRTLERHYKEHYGPSEQQDTAIKRALAIPYIASNKPNERSRFGNPLEVVNYTIQGLLKEGMNEALLLEILRQWQNAARAEFVTKDPPFKTFSDTPTAQRIDKFLQSTGLSLETLHLNTPQDEQAFLNYIPLLQKKNDLIYAALEDFILPQISIDPSVLHSDAYNHVDIYHTVQGLSGTPSNYHTYHHRLQYNPKTSIGTDGYLINVLKEKQTPITQIPFKDLKTFLNALLKQNDDKTHAIIDVNASFAGYRNLDVAQQLAAHSKTFNPMLRYILYFNDEDVLCALDVNTKKSIILATSDEKEIEKKLGCSSDAWFTYYDQSHTIGTDIKQFFKAYALVLADRKTNLSSFLQGVMRMRQLDEQQGISIVVPEDTPTSLDSLIALMDKNEQEQLKEDVFYSALAQMDNVIRRDLLNRIAQCPNPHQKAKLAQSFKAFFVEDSVHSLSKLYGGIQQENDTKFLFETHQMKVLTQWEHCLNTKGFKCLSEEKETLKTLMQEIINNSLPHCKKTMKTKNVCPLGTEVEYEKEKEQYKEKEKLLEKEHFSSYLIQEKRHSWLKNKANKTENALQQFIKQGSHELMHPLNHHLPKPAIFSPNLWIDENYAKVFEHQEKLSCSYLKPVHTILFRQHAGKLTACILDTQDLKEISRNLKGNKDTKVWITTTNHKVLAGAAPKNILNQKEYQSLIEQVRYFNGELNQLKQHRKSWVWLNKNTMEKLNYFHNYLFPYRETKINELKQLKTEIQKNNKTQFEDAKLYKQNTNNSLRFFNQDDKKSENSSVLSNTKRTQII